MCIVDTEDIHQALFNFNRAKKVWNTLGLLTKVKKVLTYDKVGLVVLEEMICSSQDGPLFLE